MSTQREPSPHAVGDHRYWAVEANNRAWSLVEAVDFDARQAADAHAAAWCALWHWNEHISSLDVAAQARAPQRLRALQLVCCVAARRNDRTVTSLADRVQQEQARLTATGADALTAFDRAMTSLCVALARPCARPFGACVTVDDQLEVAERELISLLTCRCSGGAS